MILRLRGLKVRAHAVLDHYSRGKVLCCYGEQKYWKAVSQYGGQKTARSDF